MKKLIEIKLKQNELETVQFIANKIESPVLIQKSELGLFNEFIVGDDKELAKDVDYVLFT